MREALEPAGPAAEKSSACAWARAVKRALDYLESNPWEPYVRRLGDVANASERTLQRAFPEYFGVGPQAYALTLRLNAVRADLLTAEPGGVMVKVLTIRAGFPAHGPVFQGL